MTGTRIFNLALLSRYCLATGGILILCGCDRVTPANITGSYTRTAPGLSENLLVKTDGTFEQTVTFTDGEKFTVEDTWTNEYRQVSLKRFYVTFDVETGKTIRPPELRYAVNLEFGQDTLVKNAASGYLFRKQPQDLDATRQP